MKKLIICLTIAFLIFPLSKTKASVSEICEVVLASDTRTKDMHYELLNSVNEFLTTVSKLRRALKFKTDIPKFCFYLGQLSNSSLLPSLSLRHNNYYYNTANSDPVKLPKAFLDRYRDMSASSLSLDNICTDKEEATEQVVKQAEKLSQKLTDYRDYLIDSLEFLKAEGRIAWEIGYGD